MSARESQSGRPLAVFGPQTAYFSPQVLMEQDVHAPGYDARGVAFPGVNLFVQLGRGRDYAWSATTSAQDIVDTFAVELCDDTHYRFRGRCREIEVLERTNEWSPNAADPTPAGSETLTIERTALGIVIARGEIRGKPVAFTRLRSTYRHETDSGLAFSHFNDPDRIRGPRSFQRAAALIPFTFNWFYVDSEHIAYQNAGANPLRARGVDPSLPIAGPQAVRVAPLGPGRDPALAGRVLDAAARRTRTWSTRPTSPTGTASRRAATAPPTATGATAPSTARSCSTTACRALVAGARKATLPQLAEAMADAATVDLRGDAVLPWALRVLARRARATTVAKLRAWLRDGAHRIDATATAPTSTPRRSGSWTRGGRAGCEAQFEPVLGKRLFDAMTTVHPLDNHPNNHGDHVGSAWQDGWYSFAQKDLRTLLGRRVRGRWSRTYCGRGSLARCRRALARSLNEALAADPAELYADRSLRRRGPRRRAGLLRRDLAPPARRHHPAADPVAEPADVPAGRRDPGAACRASGGAAGRAPAPPASPARPRRREARAPLASSHDQRSVTPQIVRPVQFGARAHTRAASAYTCAWRRGSVLPTSISVIAADRPIRSVARNSARRRARLGASFPVVWCWKPTPSIGTPTTLEVARERDQRA